MPKEQVVGIAARLFSIYLALETLRYTSSLIPYVSAPPPNNVSFAFIGTLAFFPLVAAFLLWRFPLSVAVNIIPEIKNQEQHRPLGSRDIELIAFSVMGLWVLTTAIRDIFFWATFTYQVKINSIGNPTLTPENIGNIVATIVELIVGFWLLFGSRGIVEIIRRARQA